MPTSRSGFLFLAVCAFLSFPCEAAVNGARADALLERFAREKGECAAVVLNARSGRIEYIYNRECAVSRRYPPGSIAKGWSAAVLLDSPGFDPSRRVNCSGRFVPPQAASFRSDDENSFNLLRDSGNGELYFKCSTAKGHGPADLRKALVESCNVYFLTSAAQCDGFCEKLISTWHLDDPLVPGRDCPAQAYFAKGTPFLKIACAIGEGGLVQVSPLKAAQCYAALFENTPLLQPYEGDGVPSVRQDLAVSAQARQYIRTALSRTAEEGTLSKVAVPRGVRILAGKTGTATRCRKKFARHGWNVLWIEANGERYVVVSFVAKGSGPREAAALSSVILDGLWRDEKN